MDSALDALEFEALMGCFFRFMVYGPHPRRSALGRAVVAEQGGCAPSAFSRLLWLSGHGLLPRGCPALPGAGSAASERMRYRTHPQLAPIRPRSRLSTLGGTRPETSPPKLKTSFNMRELTNEEIGRASC